MDTKILLEKSLAPVFIIQRGRFVHATKAFADIFGCSADDILALEKIEDLISGDENGMFLENLQKCLRGAMEKLVCRVKGHRKDGLDIPLKLQGSSEIFNGQPAFIGSLIDLTECDRAMKDLALSEWKYKEIFNNAQVGIYRTRVSDGLILDCNQRLAKIWGV